MVRKNQQPFFNPFFFSVGILFMLSLSTFILLIRFVTEHKIVPRLPFVQYADQAIILSQEYTEPEGIYSISLPSRWLASYYPWTEGPVNRSWTYFASEIEPNTFFTISAELIETHEANLQIEDFPALADKHVKQRMSKLIDFDPMIQSREAISLGDKNGIRYTIHFNTSVVSGSNQDFIWIYLPVSSDFLLIIEQEVMDSVAQEKVDVIHSSLQIY
jgi:hypothetical protein